MLAIFSFTIKSVVQLLIIFFAEVAVLSYFIEKFKLGKQNYLKAAKVLAPALITTGILSFVADRISFLSSLSYLNVILVLINFLVFYVFIHKIYKADWKVALQVYILTFVSFLIISVVLAQILLAFLN